MVNRVGSNPLSTHSTAGNGSDDDAVPDVDPSDVCGAQVFMHEMDELANLLRDRWPPVGAIAGVEACLWLSRKVYWSNGKAS